MFRACENQRRLDVFVFKQLKKQGIFIALVNEINVLLIRSTVEFSGVTETLAGLCRMVPASFTISGGMVAEKKAIAFS
jgi:hypothetical protein